MKRHQPDALSLLFGAAFAVVGLMLLNDPTPDSVALAWAAPATTIVVAVLVVVATRPGRQRTPVQEESAEHAAAEEGEP